MPHDVSQVWLTTPGTALRDAQASQTVGAFTQNADAQVVPPGTLDVAQVWLGVPDTSLPTRNASASQAVGAFVTTASGFDIVGTITGGGTITDGYPHRSASATQTVGAFQQSAAGGGAGVLGPILASSARAVGAFTQAAQGDVQATATALQQVGDFGTVARNFDATPARKSGGGSAGPRISRQGRRYIAEVGGVTVTADTLAELQRKVAQLQAQMPEDAPEPPPKAAPEPVVVQVADPVPEAPAAVPAEQVDAMVQAFIAQQEALVAQYQREVEALKLQSLTNTATLRASMQQEIEQRVAQASSDMDAVVALLMDEPAVMSAQTIPVPVMLPAPLSRNRDDLERRTMKASKNFGETLVKGIGDALVSSLAEVMSGEIKATRAEAESSVRPLHDEIAKLREEIARLSGPKRVVRENGRVTGVMVGDEFRPVERDEAGRVVGI